MNLNVIASFCVILWKGGWRVKLVWKITLVNAAAMIGAALIILWLHYSTLERSAFAQPRKILEEAIRILEKERRFAPKTMKARIVLRRIFVKIDDVIVNDPYGVGGNVKDLTGIQRVGEEYFYSLFSMRNGRRILVATVVTGVVNTLRLVMRNMFFISVIISIIYVLLSYIVSSYSLNPIKILSQKLSLIGASNLSSRLEVPKSNDELRKLVVEINNMLERIERAYKSQERFVHDVSHELRNPLASMKGFVKIIKKWGLKKREILLESVDELEKLVDEMMDLVNNLLVLARAGVFQKEMVDVRKVVEEVLENLTKAYGNKSVSIEGEAIIETSKEHFKIIIKNVLENALKFSKSSVDVIIEDGRVVVEDDGPGIPEEERNKVFEKFYRGDASRDRRIPGHGLGLAIVKEMCELLGMDVVIGSSNKGGAKVGVIWKRSS